MKIKYLIGSCFLITNLYSQQYSLKELINIALENNTDISSSTLNSLTKKASIQASKSLYLPSLTAVVEGASYDTENAANKSDGSVNSLTLSASQLLYDFGQSIITISSSKEEYKASLEELIVISSSTVLSVKEAYYNILNKQKLIEVATESITIDELQENQAREYLKAGIKTKIDLTKAQLQLSNSKLELLKANFALKVSKAEFLTILGKDLGASFYIKKETKEISKLIKNIKKDFDLQRLISSALENKAEIAMHKALVNSANQNYKASKAKYYPSLKAKGSYVDSSSNEVSSLDYKQYSVGVYLEWNLFSGFKTQATSTQSLMALKTSKEKLKQQELLVKKDVSLAYYDLKESIEALNISSLNVNLAEQTLQLAQDRYKNGLNDLLELSASKLDFIKSKNDLVNTYYTYKIALASLDYASGIIYK